MRRPLQTSEVLRCIIDQAFIRRTKIFRTVANRILPNEMMKASIDKTPIEAIVIGDKGQLSIRNDLQPTLKLEYLNWRGVKCWVSSHV